VRFVTTEWRDGARCSLKQSFADGTPPPFLLYNGDVGTDGVRPKRAAQRTG